MSADAASATNSFIAMVPDPLIVNATPRTAVFVTSIILNVVPTIAESISALLTGVPLRTILDVPLLNVPLDNVIPSSTSRRQESRFSAPNPLRVTKLLTSIVPLPQFIVPPVLRNTPSVETSKPLPLNVPAPMLMAPDSPPASSTIRLPPNVMEPVKPDDVVREPMVLAAPVSIESLVELKLAISALVFGKPLGVQFPLLAQVMLSNNPVQVKMVIRRS